MSLSRRAFLTSLGASLLLPRSGLGQIIPFGFFKGETFTPPTFEFVAGGSGNSSYTTTASSGSPQPLAIIAYGGTESAGSATVSGVQFNSAWGDFYTGTQDNGDSEHCGVGLGLKNTTGSHTIKAVWSGSVSNTGYAYLRIMGSGSSVSCVYSNTQTGISYPYNYNIPNLQVGDLVVWTAAYRGSTGSSATNMTFLGRQFFSGRPNHLDIHLHQMTTAGTFSTSVNIPGRYQQWCHIMAVFRVNP